MGFQWLPEPPFADCVQLLCLTSWEQRWTGCTLKKLRRHNGTYRKGQNSITDKQAFLGEGAVRCLAGRHNQGRHGEEVALSRALKGMSGSTVGREGSQNSIFFPCYPRLNHLRILSKKQILTLQVKERRQRSCISNKLPGDAVTGSKDRSGTTELLPPCTSLTFKVGSGLEAVVQV